MITFKVFYLNKGVSDEFKVYFLNKKCYMLKK